MAAVLSTNMASLYAQKNLSTAQASLSASVQRLSSGTRINSAKDDAAGYGIAESVKSTKNIVDQNIRNAKDGISWAQTAEGALDVVGKILQRAMTLATQKTDATLNTAQTDSINAELDALATEVSNVKTRTKFQSDSVFGTAEFDTLNNVFIGTLFDTVNSADSFSAVGTYLGSITETASGVASVQSQAAFAGNISEAASVIATIVARSVFAASQTEAGSGAATFATQVAFTAAITEGVLASAVFASQVNFAAVLAEAVSGIDNYTTAATFVASLTETASGIDSLQGGFLLNAAISETASVIDLVAARVVFTGTVQEFASVIAAQSVIKTVNANVTGIQLLVSIGDVLVWAVIDDSQNANWQNINNAQSSGWVLVANSQTAGWQTIDNAQSSGWVLINNPQAPGWNDLPS